VNSGDNYNTAWGDVVGLGAEFIIDPARVFFLLYNIVRFGR